VGLPIPLVGSVCRLGALLAGGLVARGASGDALRSIGAGKDHGMSAADVQARVQAMIDHRVASGDEVGVQVAVVEHGQVAVDAVSGSADRAKARPWVRTRCSGLHPQRRAWPRPSPMCWWSGASSPTTCGRSRSGPSSEPTARTGSRSGTCCCTLRACPPRRTTRRSSSCATGSTCARCSPRPSPGGSLAAASATTPRPSASCSARSCGERRAAPCRGGFAR
jgi:hypothetical protein